MHGVILRLPPYVFMGGAELSTGYAYMAWCLVKPRENFTF